MRMTGAGAVIDPWSPPTDCAEWMLHPEQRANYLAALERHNEHSFIEAVALLEMWRREVDGESAIRPRLEGIDGAGTSDLVAELVRIAHARRRLDRAVAASFKDVAAAVGISAERLAEAVRAALETERAA